MAKASELIAELPKLKVDVTLGGIQYPNGEYVCMTGKEKCCLCSKALTKSFILKK
jgi:hypothetical protein